MVLRFKCSCGHDLRASDNQAGKTGKCPKCGTLVAIPSKANLAGTTEQASTPSKVSRKRKVSGKPRSSRLGRGSRSEIDAKWFWMSLPMVTGFLAGQLAILIIPRENRGAAVGLAAFLTFWGVRDGIGSLREHSSSQKRASAGSKCATSPASVSHGTVPSESPAKAVKSVRAPKDKLAQAMDILERTIPCDSLAACPWKELSKTPEAASQAALNILAAFAYAKHPHCGNVEGKMNFSGVQCLLMLVSQFKVASASPILHAIRDTIQRSGLGSRVYDFKELDERCDVILRELPIIDAHTAKMGRKALEYTARLPRNREHTCEFWMNVSSLMGPLPMEPHMSPSTSAASKAPLADLDKSLPAIKKGEGLFTLKEIADAALSEDGTGFCCACGARPSQTKQFAHSKCKHCGKDAVFGASVLMLMLGP